MATKRLLITGSRTWDKPEVIAYWLARFAKKWHGHRRVLISGHCPYGADRLAEAVAHEFGFQLHLVPANWKQHGRRAGFVRNTEMVEMQPDHCIAFIRDGSNGATMCRNLAKARGIPTKTVLYDSHS